MTAAGTQVLKSAGEGQTKDHRPLGRVVMHWVRRLHLYLGLFLFPWAVLYGFTGFLFNHPRIMNEQQRTLQSFSQQAWAGSLMEHPTGLNQTVQAVVTQLQSRSGTELHWVQTEPVKYSGEFAFARIDSDLGETSLLLDVHGHGGTTRLVPPKPASKQPESAPWSIVPQSGATTPPANPLLVPGSLADQLQQSLPILARNLKLPEGKLNLTSVPDLVFVVDSGGQRWRAAYNSFKGTVTTKPYEPTASLPVRNFLLRLHTTHVYPVSGTHAKWMWVLGADVMGLILVYWGISGICMWWQIKSTRRWGAACLTLGTLCALGLASTMHSYIHSLL